MDPRDPALGQLRNRPKGDESTYLVIPDAGRVYLPGTTIPAIAAKYLQRADGLLVPEAVARGPQPIDLIKTFVTYTELFGHGAPEGYVAEAIASVPRMTFLAGLARLLGAYEKLNSSRATVDEALTRSWFREPAIGIIRSLFRQNATLVAPQALLLLMQLALVGSPDEPPPDGTPHPLPAVILALQDSLGVSDDDAESHVFTGDTRSALFRQVVASHHFGSTEDEGTAIAHHANRWSRLSRDHAADRGSVDLDAAFRAATGIDKEDFTAVGLAIWAHCETHDAYPIAASAFDSFRMPPDVAQRALGLMSGTADELRDLILATPADFQTEWSFDTIRRYPILRLDDGSVLVLSKALLIDRIFGWLPTFDLIQGLRSTGRQKEAEHALGWFRHVCELDALQSITSLAGPRLYGEQEIQRAFGTAAPNADATIDYPDAWVTIEIGTRQLSRATVVATTPDGLEDDLHRGIDEKVRQLDATIQELISDESRLTGSPARARGRYFAVLVLTEGFPVNPMTTTAIRERLAAADLLRDPRIGPLHIIDQEELDMAEAIAEEGGPSLRELLEEHERSNLRASALKDWLILDRGRGLGPRRPRRLEAVRESAWQPAVDRLRGEAEHDDRADE